MQSYELPLFPLQAVVFPGTRLSLQVFEARYLDLISRCLREGQGFGIVKLVDGSEVRRSGEPQPSFAPVGVQVQVMDVDMPRVGLMHVSLHGQRRFRFGNTWCADNGLWMAQATALPDDAVLQPLDDHAPAVELLRKAFDSIDAQHGEHATTPAADRRFDDAGWVAFRWCELLPLNVDARQRLLEMDNPLERLTIVARLLSQETTH